MKNDEKRDKLALKYIQNTSYQTMAYAETEAFKAGWNACVTDFSDSHRYRQLMTEVEALKAEVERLRTSNQYWGETAVKGDRWKEMAGKLAEAISNFKIEVEDPDVIVRGLQRKALWEVLTEFDRLKKESEG